jgi:DNA invertase Pin-like site-specific DNA recombinase
LRVSTDRQAQHGLGLDVQRQGIRAWPASKDTRSPHGTPTGESAWSNGLDNRDGLPDAVAEVRDGRAGGLVI